ncbi:hypothetical protein BU17DRAFT_60058 [Hysterangium stoloniferum]|nr:hypothetical protein BU17DRAFT_60058 [Hysterangium stoloniferum]
MSKTLEVVQSILVALGDSTIPIESLTSTAIALSLQCIANANHTDNTHGRDTVGVDSFFWALWDGVYKLAEEGDKGIQERLVTFLKGEKASEVGEQWVVRGVKGRWNTLPLLGDMAKDIWNGPNIPPTLAMCPKSSSAPDLFTVVKACQGYLNLQCFAAWLWHEVHVDFPRVLALNIIHIGLKVSEGTCELDLDIGMVSIHQASDDESDDEDYNPNYDLINDLSLDVEDNNDHIKTPCPLEVEAAATWMTPCETGLLSAQH